MPRDAYVVVQSPDIESHDEAEVSIPEDLGVLLAWDRSRRAGIAVTTEEEGRHERLRDVCRAWGWYALDHTSATSAQADVARFPEEF